jgi:hypothetical protein
VAYSRLPPHRIFAPDRNKKEDAGPSQAGGVHWQTCPGFRPAGLVVVLLQRVGAVLHLARLPVPITGPHVPPAP